MKFSERMGFKKVAEVIQVESMNDSLRNGIWNVLYNYDFGERGFTYSSSHSTPARIEPFSKVLWARYFKEPIDGRPRDNPKIFERIRKYFFQCQWHEVYDFVEFCVRYYKRGYYKDELSERLNNMLESELSGYRIIEGKVAPISSTEEVNTIQDAIGDRAFPEASKHLKSALEHLSRKTNPDYRNSIKESISAVESICCKIAGSKSAKFADSLKQIADKHELHAALKAGFLKLYGYTSDGDGIRHAMLEETTLTQADATYFLVSCSAFVNYLKSKIIK